MPAADPRPRVVVVGAGVAGLVVARELVLAGRDVVVLEKSDRVGGQVARHSVAGIDLDAGAEAYATRGDELPRLLASLGLDTDIVTPSPSPAWVQRASGGAVPLPETSLLGIPGVPLAQDVIDAIGLPAALRAQLDMLMPSLVGSKAVTVGELVRRRMGRAVLDGLVAPVARGVHSTDPDELDLDRVAPGLRQALMSTGSLGQAVRSLRAKAPAGSLVASLRGGMFRLVDALAADLERFGVQVRTSAEVTAFDHGGVALASGERVRGEVVLAAPLDTLAARTRVQVATIAVDAPALSAAPRGTGVLVAPGVAGVGARALTHLTAKWSWLAEKTPLHLLRLSYDEGVDVTPQLVRRDAEVLLGTPIPAPVDLATVAWERVGRRPHAQHAIDGMHRVGEAESGTGLAAVVSYARSIAGAIPPRGSAGEG